MGVGLTIIVVWLLILGVIATTYGIIHDTEQDYRVLVVSLIGFMVTLVVMFSIGIQVGNTKTVYDFGCKQSPTIVVNRTEYRCTP